MKLRAAFMILPGTEEMAGHDDYGLLLRAALLALAWMVAPALVIAWSTASRE